MPIQPEDPSLNPDDDMTVPESPSNECDDTAELAAGLDLESSDSPATDVDADEVSVESLQTELDEARQRALRLQAELENYRKRAQRTLGEERRYASLPLLRDLLTVVDNLQRAIEAAQQNEGAAGLLEGVEMVAGQLTNILKQHHCKEIPAEGTRFDPNMHEAIAQFPSEEHQPGDVSQVTQVGYQLHDRVIRPSQVIVAAPKPDAE